MIMKWFEKRKAKKIAESKAIEDENQCMLLDRAGILAEEILENREKQKQEKIKEAEGLEAEELRLSKIALEARRKKKKESPDFYLEIVAERVTENGVEIELDWNDACITYLENAGYKAPTEELIVYKYLASLNRSVQLEQMASEYIENQNDEIGKVAPYTEEDIKELNEE